MPTFISVEYDPFAPVPVDHDPWEGQPDPYAYDPFADTAGANAAWVQPGQHTYNTLLQPNEETAFRGWLQQNNVPFNPEAGMTDYDMRGFWRGVQTGDPHAQTEINKNDQQIHYNDWWKTPQHQSFSRGSQWATPNAPYWANDHQLVDEHGNVMFDERPQAIPIQGTGFKEGEVMPPPASRQAGYDAYRMEIEAAQQPGRDEALREALAMRDYGSTIPTVEAQQNAVWGQPISDRRALDLFQGQTHR